MDLDCGVGSIVWVRRRNGSWWPGQILGPDELSASHLTSPRSGTPVKLLGREDASVDWYNLEKSKRVKAFRCGEFDDCIHKAQSSHSKGGPFKKREKYARREDAILHALQLENQRITPSVKIPALTLPIDIHANSYVFCAGGPPDTHSPRSGQIRPSPAKRTRCLYFPNESSDSLEYRETQPRVQMSPSQHRRHFRYHGSLIGDTEYTFMDDVESDSSEISSTDSDSDPSETEPDLDDDMTVFSETSHDAEEHESTSSEELDELALSSDMPHLYPRDLVTCNEAVSKWQLKGKRNNRNLVKRSIGASDGKCNIYEAGADVERRNSHLRHSRMGPSLHRYKFDFGECDTFEDDDQNVGLEDEYSLTSRSISKSQSKIRRAAAWNDLAWDDHLASKGYWDGKAYSPIYGDRYHFDGRVRPMLVDVDLKVQARYRKEHVPFISLMSKLDGRSIVGHPIQVEALKDGSSDIPFHAINDFSNDGNGIEGSSVLPPAWRTARRTANFRVPRPHVPSSNGDEVAAEFPSSDQEQNFEYNAGSSSYQASLLKKSGLKSHGLSADKKSFKKVPKKPSLSTSQKTRTLSSLSIEHNLSRKSLHDSCSYQTDRLIKAEISGPTTVACIPVQLVFSRLLEKINRPPLKTACTAALLNTGVERNS